MLSDENLRHKIMVKNQVNSCTHLQLRPGLSLRMNTYTPWTHQVALLQSEEHTHIYILCVGVVYWQQNEIKGTQMSTQSQGVHTEMRKCMSRGPLRELRRMTQFRFMWRE